jgi:hypothetical protein
MRERGRPHDPGLGSPALAISLVQGREGLVPEVSQCDRMWLWPPNLAPSQVVSIANIWWACLLL